MKLEVLESTNKKLVFELEGADHTFCNTLKDELSNDPAVTISAYNVSHPLVGKPKFFLETNKESTPKEALERAIAELKKKNNAFTKAFSALK
jgi:DNA-directed RNA polymerase subunit L